MDTKLNNFELEFTQEQKLAIKEKMIELGANEINKHIPEEQYNDNEYYIDDNALFYIVMYLDNDQQDNKRMKLIDSLKCELGLKYSEHRKVEINFEQELVIYKFIL